MSSIKSIREFIDKHGGGITRSIKLAQEPLPYRKKMIPEFHISFNLDTKYNQFNILKSSPLITRLIENIDLIYDNQTSQVNKFVLSSLIPDFSAQLLKNMQLTSYTIDTSIFGIEDPDELNHSISLLIDILSCKSIILTIENASELLKISKPLQMDSLSSFLTNFIQRAKENIEKISPFKDEINKYNDLLLLLLDLSKENMNSSIASFLSTDIANFDKNLILNVIEVASNSKPYSNEILVLFCKGISEQLKVDDLFEEISRENFFFLYQLFINGLINKEKLLKSISQETPELFLWFSPELEKFNKNGYYDLLKKFQGSFMNFSKKPKKQSKTKVQPVKSIYFNFETFISNIKKFYEDDWKLLKEMRKNGSNSSEIAVCIRSDDLNSLQEILKTEDLDQKIEPSIFERCKLLKNDHIRLIEYAAFFGSINCFKYLLTNSNKLYNSFKYAVAGGCIEIIRICENSNSNMINGINTSIQFSQNNIFEWIFDSSDILNSIPSNHPEISEYYFDLDINLGYTELSYKYGNLFALDWFIDHGFDITNYCLIAASKNGNILLIKLFFALGLLPNDSDCLHFAIENGHATVLKFIIEKGIDSFKKMSMPNYIFNAIQSEYPNVLEVLIDCDLFDINSSKRYISPTDLVINNNYSTRQFNNEYDDDSSSLYDDEYDDDVAIINKPKKYLFKNFNHNNYNNINNLFNADVNDDDGETPLIAAARKGNLEIMKILLKKKDIINLNAVNKDGMTALMIAAECGFDQIVKELIAIPEVDLNIKKGTLTAGKIASNKGYFKIGSLLMTEQRKRARISSS